MTTDTKLSHTSVTGPNSAVNKTKEEKLFAKAILTKQMPTYRQAYSDRTAWLMSCAAELAYVKFNPLLPSEKLQKAFNKKVDEYLNGKKKSLLTALLGSFSYDAKDQEKILTSDLDTISLKLIKTFDVEDTQAFIAVTDDFVVLSFRGTESNKPKDIKSDFKAMKVKCVSGGMIHSGFSEAFDVVSQQVQTALNDPDVAKKPLFITGHSLGGALATIAAKRLTHNSGIAGCYTFGSPRVGDTNWVAGLRAPVYRVVNAVDCVTMMPPGGEIIACLSKLLSLIPFFEPASSLLQKNFGGYLHSGDMRYLTNCENGDFETVKLLSSVSWMYRMMGLVKNYFRTSKVLKDHSMVNYRTKLSIIARRRNLDEVESP
jgi:hypothetical protein